MADKAAEVIAEGKKAFALYSQQQAGKRTLTSGDEPTFLAGFMAGYLMGFAEGLEDDVFGAVVSKMLKGNVNAIVVPFQAHKYALKLERA